MKLLFTGLFFIISINSFAKEILLKNLDPNSLQVVVVNNFGPLNSLEIFEDNVKIHSSNYLFPTEWIEKRKDSLDKIIKQAIENGRKLKLYDRFNGFSPGKGRLNRYNLDYMYDWD